jgi:uncharacterized membrane protein
MKRALPWTGADTVATVVAVFTSVGAIAIAPSLAFCYGACSSSRVTISALNIALALIAAPLAETFVVQGCVYDFARSVTGAGRSWPAVVASALLFIALHGAITLELGVAALSLSLLRRVTLRLDTVVAAHAATNAAVLVLVLRS